MRLHSKLEATILQQNCEFSPGSTRLEGDEVTANRWDLEPDVSQNLSSNTQPWTSHSPSESAFLSTFKMTLVSVCMCLCASTCVHLWTVVCVRRPENNLQSWFSISTMCVLGIRSKITRLGAKFHYPMNLFSYLQKDDRQSQHLYRMRWWQL